NAANGAGGAKVVDSTGGAANNGHTDGTGGNGKSPTNGSSAVSAAANAPANVAPNAATSATAGKPAGGRVSFEVPPGQLSLRLSVEGAAGQVLDSDMRDLGIPDYTKAEPAISEPSIYRARTQRDTQPARVRS